MGMLPEDRALMPTRATKAAAVAEQPQAESPIQSTFRRLVAPPTGGAPTPAPPQSTITSKPPKYAMPSAESMGTAGIGASRPSVIPMPVDMTPIQPDPVFEWSESKSAPTKPVFAGSDRFGDVRIQSGLSHPENYGNFNNLGLYTNPGPGGTMRPIAEGDGNEVVPRGDAYTPLDAAGGGLMAVSEIVNDVNQRLGNARKWAANDPDDKTDDPIYRYTTPLKDDGTGGNTYVAAPLGEAVMGGDGKPLKKADGTDVVGELEYYWKLPDGTTVSSSDLLYAPFDPGKKTRKIGFGQSERSVPAEWLVGIPDDQFSHSQFGDGTIFSDSTGYYPEWIAKSEKEQINKKRFGKEDYTTEEYGMGPLAAGSAAMDWMADGLNLGVDDPRPMWENKSGDSFWEGDYYSDLREGFEKGGIAGALGTTTLDEAVPWLLDMNLNSAPYYVPGYNYVAGASSAMPYMFGYAGDTYMPSGTGFENLDQLGQGTYKYKDLSNSQRVGGVLAPLVDAAAERFSGKAIGGIPKFMRGGPVGKFLTKNPVGRIIGSALMEGAEEVASSGLQQMQQEGLANLGRRRANNDNTGEIEFVPGSWRGETMPETAFQDFLAGSVLGGGMTVGGEMFRAPANWQNRVPKPKAPKAARGVQKNPVRTQADLDALGTLDRKYEDEGTE